MQGMYITTSIGNLYPESMLALHLNFALAMPPPLTKSPLGFVRFLATHMLNLYTPEEKAGLKAAQDYQDSGGYYLHMMRTRPQTVRAMLADSPVALMAWIYEKLIAWTDNYPWTDQEVCEWVSLYWFSRAGPAASVTIYHEMFQGEWQAETGRGIPSAKLVSELNVWLGNSGSIGFKKTFSNGAFQQFEGVLVLPKRNRWDAAHVEQAAGRRRL